MTRHRLRSSLVLPVAVALVALATLGVGCAAALQAASAAQLQPASAAAAGPGQAGWRRLDVHETATYALRYLPPGLGTAQPLPVVVFLHGSGSSPEAWQPILAPVADAAGCLLLVPRAVSGLGFGVGRDDATLAGALLQLEAELPVDPARISIAGHSAGGAYALYLAYAEATRFNAVFTLSAPFRQLLSLADADYTAPIRMYYGTDDPNYQGGDAFALTSQWGRLGVPWETEVRTGFGHSSWPDSTLPDGFAFLLAKRYGTPGGCLPTDTRLCLAGGRFAVEGTWTDFEGNSGPVHVLPRRTPYSGALWFRFPDTYEVLVKLLDACTINHRFWVFVTASANIEYHLTVTDLAAHRSVTYDNPLGRSSPAIDDFDAFATCP